jgi:prepilin-type N-terminal cleavage/methylation domain-containing protein
MLSGKTFRVYIPRVTAIPARNAFTLIEILIVVVILGILAAIVIPHFSNASNLARENTMKDELRYLRTQVIVFKAQHGDISPGYPGGDVAATPDGTNFADQMTRYTDAKCNVVATADGAHPFGPYLSQIPTNQINGKSDVKIVTNDPRDPGNVDGTTGWIFNPETLEFIANIQGNGSDGVAYANY